MKYIGSYSNTEIPIDPKVSPKNSSSKVSPLTQPPPSINASRWTKFRKGPAVGTRNVPSRFAEKLVHGDKKTMNTNTPQDPRLIATSVKRTHARFVRWLWKRQTTKASSKLCAVGKRISEHAGNEKVWQHRVFLGEKAEQGKDAGRGTTQEGLLNYIKGLEEVSSQLRTLSGRATDSGIVVYLSDFTELMLKLNRVVRLRDGLTVEGVLVDKGVLKCERDLLAKSASIHKQIRASIGARGAYEKSIFMEFTEPVEGEEFLGKGKFGQVKRIFLPAKRFSSRGTLSRNMALYAANKTAIIEKSYFDTEANAFTIFGKHPNILEKIFIQRKKLSAQFSLVSEDAGTSLQSLISREKKMSRKMTSSWDPKWSCLEPNLVKNIVSQCINGLAHIHSLNFVHGDIHPGNVLIDKRGTVKLVDFGQAFSPNILEGMRKSTTLPTPHRLILMEWHSKELDIFRLGYFLYACLNFDGNMFLPNGKLQKCITKETYEKEFLSLVRGQLEDYKQNALAKFHPGGLQHGDAASETQKAISCLCDMALNCLKFSPNERPSIEDLQKRFPIPK